MLTNFHKEWTKIVNFSSMANFWTCAGFFTQTLHNMSWLCQVLPITTVLNWVGYATLWKNLFMANRAIQNEEGQRWNSSMIFMMPPR